MFPGIAYRMAKEFGPLVLWNIPFGSLSRIEYPITS